MKHVLRFKAEEWNRLRGLLTNPECPYLCIHGDRIMATNRKVVTIRKLPEKVTGKRPVFIHIRDMVRLIGTGYARVKITDDKVWVRYSKATPIRIKYAYDKIDFPAVSSLSKQEKKEKDTVVSFAVSKDVLKGLIDSSPGDMILIRVHAKSKVARWRSGSEQGLFAQSNTKGL